MKIYICLILITLLSTVIAFSTGPPPRICLSPYPHHFNNNTPIFSQTNMPSPYSIVLSSNTYTDGLIIRISITSNISTTFKGIMITFKPNTSEITVPVGTFLSCDAPGFQFYNIQDSNSSCLVHSNGNMKPKIVTCLYAAPYANYGPLRMSTVILNNYSTFWTRQEQVLTYQGSSPLQGNLITTQITSNDINITACAITKSCVFFPNLCTISNTCVYMVSYKKSGAYVDFEIMGPDKGFFAIAISYDTKMNDDLIIMCATDPDANAILVQTGFSTLINNMYQVAYYSVDKNIINRKAGKSFIMNSMRICTFSVIANLTYSSNVTYPTDLSKKLNIFVANGILYPNTSFIRKHDEPPMILFTSIILYTDKINPNTYFNGLEYGKQVHGSLMTVAFMIFMPIAVMVARHFRYNLSVNVFGKQLWFYIHVIFNICFYIFAFSGYFYIISIVEGNWELAPQIHGSVGTVVMILSTINIIIGFTRPDIGAPRREYFYWAHFINGILIRLLTFATFWLVFFTITLRIAFKNWMMMVIIIWTGGEIIFSIIYGILREVKCGEKSKSNYQVNDTNVTPAQSNHVGKFGLVIYILFALTLAVALLCGLWIN